MDINKYKVKHKSDFKMSDILPNKKSEITSKEKTKKLLQSNIDKMAELQSKLFAQDKYSLLIIFQAMDTAGKDGTIKHVMSGLNPQATQVQSFKQPSVEELNHDYLWRAVKCLPERGTIGIFNRSYYEEVLVVRVHELAKTQQLPKEHLGNDIWKNRFRQIRDFERYLFENGTIVLKFFLNISKDEQKDRLLERINNKDKNWKFSSADIKERQYWDKYQLAYQDAINETSSKHAPWFVIPANKKTNAHLLVSEVIVKTLESLNLEYPSIKKEQELLLKKCKSQLINERL